MWCSLLSFFSAVWSLSAATQEGHLFPPARGWFQVTGRPSRRGHRHTRWPWTPRPTQPVTSLKSRSVVGPSGDSWSRPSPRAASDSHYRRFLWCPGTLTFQPSPVQDKPIVLSRTPVGATRHKRPSIGPRGRIWATLIFVSLLSRISIPSGLTSHLLSYETLWTPSLAPAVRPMETKIMQERISRHIPCSQYSAFCQHCSLFCRNFYGYTIASYTWLHVYSFKKKDK